MTPDAPPAALVIREVTSADRAAIAFSFARLGEESRYKRFLAPTPDLRPRDLDRLLSVDHWHRESLLAYSPVPRAPVGMAEYVRLEMFDVAEVAMAVADQWQRHGIGQALLGALRDRALGAGVRRFEFTTLRGNKGALALAHHLGKCTTASAGLGVIQLLVEL